MDVKTGKKVYEAMDSYDGSGSHINAIVTNPDTGRVVIINGGSN